MYWLIETKSQLEEFKSLSYKEAYIEIIASNIIEHPVLNNICSIYVRPLLATKGFIIPINHSETQKLNENDILETINDLQTLYGFGEEINDLTLLGERNRQDTIINALMKVLKSTNAEISRKVK